MDNAVHKMINIQKKISLKNNCVQKMINIQKKISPKDKQLDIHDVREALVLCGKPARPVSSIVIIVIV